MPSILVIDDNSEHLELVRRVLTVRGYSVLVASEAETGLQMAIDSRPDLILLDLGLPDVDGQTLAGWLRRVPALAHTLIVACTAWPLKASSSRSAASMAVFVWRGLTAPASVRRPAV